jgi:hypothetical protein
MVSIFGESSAEIIDLLVKLSPAASIVGGLLAARHQLRNARRLNQETIAKNHYREMLEVFLKNTDILYLGTREDSYKELKAQVPKYRRYRMLFTIMGFAMQELYLSIDRKEDSNWLHMCRMFVSMFRHFILCEEDFTPFMQKSLNPDFLTFCFDTARNFVHSAAKTVAANVVEDDKIQPATPG